MIVTRVSDNAIGGNNVGMALGNLYETGNYGSCMYRTYSTDYNFPKNFEIDSVCKGAYSASYSETDITLTRVFLVYTP